MSNTNEINQLATQLQKQLESAMSDVISAQKDWNLPDLPPQFMAAYENLKKTDFYIVVCGEVKKGKSSLINALLGQDVLPTGTSETTSQIFCITNTPTESFALVFDDGSKEQITREGLTRYGSQTAANLKGDPLFNGKNLQWIEVNVPAKFLPPGIHLIDTPGLGALYPMHAEVTLRQIKLADAAIYLLDSTTPLTDTDTKFIDRILSVTKDILFVQSRIDENQTADDSGVSAWEKLNKDHQSNLEKKYGSVLGTIPVYPLSSLWLRKAADDDKHRERILARCRFDEFTNALERLIYRISGWNAACLALQAIYQYYPMGKRWLQEQTKALDPTVCRELVASKTELQNKFIAQWGPQGAKRQELTQTFQEIVPPVKKQIEKICSPDGDIARKYLDMAGEMANASIEEINAFAQSLGPNMQQDVTEDILSIMMCAYDELQRRLADMDLALPQLDFPNINLPAPKKAKNSDFLKKVRNGVGYAVVPSMLYSASATAVAAAPVMAPALPFIAVGAAALALYVGFQGYKEVEKTDSEKASGQLRNYVYEVLSSIRRALTDYDVRQGKNNCAVDNWVQEIKEAFNTSWDNMYQLENQRQQQELESIERMRLLESDKYNQKKKDLQEQSQQWAKLEQFQKQAAELLKKLEAELERPQVA